MSCAMAAAWSVTWCRKPASRVRGELVATWSGPPSSLLPRHFFTWWWFSTLYAGSMALNIKDPATDELARRLAAATGESITIAVRVGMEERLEKIERGRRTAEARPRLARYIERERKRAIRDDRTPDEILGYDEHGVAR